LHIAALHGYVGMDMIHTLLSLFLSAIHCHNDQGQLPLHVAYRKNAIPDVIKFLREFHPRAIGKIDSYGKIPS